MPVTAGGPPILVGGDTDPALRRAAGYGDGWFGWNMTPAELSHRLERLEELLATTPFVAGRLRSLAELEIQVGVRFAGSPDELATLVEAYAALGATRVAVTAVVPPSRIDERLGALAAALDVHPAAPS
jgi:alkanesulfonate monooxygenase SsuD/methylene tetrahydromethanopterin reductase-like flavin-dependent oxidoreductase (luciferase family)